MQPENWLRGRFRAECERGWLDVDFTLAPTQPPRLQFLRLTSGMPPDDGLATAARGPAAAGTSPRETTCVP